jgi:2-polyprenyl-6-methoxyphenol hydroxylase-like FAD-dependent oxidoreductase
MRIVCVGGGPAGLYFAILMKLRSSDHDITVLERSPRGSTYGWGVVYWDDLLERLHENDPLTAGEIRANSFRWVDQLVHVQGKPTASLSGHGFSISRQRLLDILIKQAVNLNVRVEFELEVEKWSQLAAADLIVACDGVNSRLRQLCTEQFKTSVVVGRNKHIWLGTTKVFDAFNFAFAETDAGWIWFHAYGFSSDGSTCIVECSPETWTGLGFDRLEADQSIRLLERTFEKHLDGHPLIAQARTQDRAPWLSFRTVHNERWHRGKVVLMGDAAHTTHFTIGSGTKLAIEDAIGLAGKLHEHGDITSAFEEYEEERQAALLLPQREARNSAQWFEDVPRYIGLEAHQFASLLHHRRSPLLARISPRRYYQLHQVAEESAVLQKLRRWAGARGRDLYVRRQAR